MGYVREIVTMKSTEMLDAQPQLEDALGVIRGIKSTMCALAEIEGDDAEIFSFFGLQPSTAHRNAQCAFGRIFFPDTESET
jgi:hypothetical protein